MNGDLGARLRSLRYRLRVRRRLWLQRFFRLFFPRSNIHLIVDPWCPAIILLLILVVLGLVFG